MAETKKDDNQVPVMMGVLNTDGSTPTRVYSDPSTHVLITGNGSTGSDLGNNNASRDNSGNPVLLAVSSSDDTTPVPLYVDSSGNLLIKSS